MLTFFSSYVLTTSLYRLTSSELARRPRRHAQRATPHQKPSRTSSSSAPPTPYTARSTTAHLGTPAVRSPPSSILSTPSAPSSNTLMRLAASAAFSAPSMHPSPATMILLKTCTHSADYLFPQVQISTPNACALVFSLLHVSCGVRQHTQRTGVGEFGRAVRGTPARTPVAARGRDPAE